MAHETDRCTGHPDSTLVMSTGVIGQRLPIDKILAGVPTAHAALGASHDHWLTAAKAICTTDTFPKLMSRTFTLPSSPGVEYRIAGMTKGAGMIHPNMATLLGVVATDAPIAAAALPPVLKHAVDRSFNSITIDGDTSTNDTIALLANGAAGGKEVVEGSPDYDAFRAVLTGFAAELAQLVVRDGEGATKFVTIRVTESPSEEAARKIASTIARSPLVKTALYGKDANWCGTPFHCMGASFADDRQGPHPVRHGLLAHLGARPAGERGARDRAREDQRVVHPYRWHGRVEAAGQRRAGES